MSNKRYLITKTQNFDLKILTDIDVQIIDNLRLFVLVELDETQFQTLSQEIGKGIKSIEIEKKYKLPDTKKRTKKN